ncbi:MAG: enoyl-CoA hydratase/isomerase family protein [Deltaproteobacteria bacterium]|nr:enoyl-CoA hydratase/isomerase family protein [Deltaproteobacteria bacterium]
MNNNKILHLEIIKDVAVVTFDDPASKVNTISPQLSSEFQEIFDEIAKNNTVKASVLISGKPDNFIAGADINTLKNAKSAEEVERLSREAQRLLDRLATTPKPVVAAIHGTCLGGGLEIALACHYRIATDHPKTVLALPEVMLGLLPGAGGTQRLPRLVGIQAALDMMLTGKNIYPRKAKKMGLIDHVAIPQGLKEIAIEAARRLSNKALRSKRRKPKLVEKVLEKTAVGRKILFSQARKMVMQKSLGLYPAPLAILDVVQQGIPRSLEQGLAYESKRFGELAQTPESKSLIHLFFGQTSLKKNRFGDPKTKVRKIGVLGGGLMGGGITSVSAQKGLQVLIKDIKLEAAVKGKKQLFDDLQKRVKQRVLSSFERDKILNRVNAQADYRGFENCQLVIEAVLEDIAIKHKVIKEMEPHLSENAIFASNTSALPIKEIAKASQRPQNIVGMHYFSPVQKMPLLEIVVTDQSSQEAKAVAVDVGLRQGKTVIVVKDGPGFYTSRILAPYMDEAAVLVQEGVGFYELDEQLKKFGYPVGPVTLLDEVGIDVGAHVGEFLGRVLGKRVTSGDPKVFEEIIAKGYLGRKTGKGFFMYDKKVRGRKPINPGMQEIIQKHCKPGAQAPSAEEIQLRMGLRMVNEAVLCLQEGVLENPVDGDIGAVFGLGFPPFHGGPFRYLDTVDADWVALTLERFSERYGSERFRPAPLLLDMAKSGKKFHPV